MDEQIPKSRLIWIGFLRNGPFLTPDKCKIAEPSFSGDTEICCEPVVSDGVFYASVTISVPYFPPQDDEHQVRVSLRRWLEQAKLAYKRYRAGETVIFRSKRGCAT